MTRKPKIEYYWTLERGPADLPPGHVVNWRLVGANGEIMCQATQGFRDKADAQRSVHAVVNVLGPSDGSWSRGQLLAEGTVREVGPGRHISGKGKA